MESSNIKIIFNQKPINKRKINNKRQKKDSYKNHFLIYNDQTVTREHKKMFKDREILRRVNTNM